MYLHRQTVQRKVSRDLNDDNETRKKKRRRKETSEGIETKRGERKRPTSLFVLVRVRSNRKDTQLFSNEFDNEAATNTLLFRSMNKKK